MNDLITTPLFGVLVTFLGYEVGVQINKKTKSPILNPLLVAITFIIIALKTLGVSYEDYFKGGEFINFMLGPATVILAVPLYKQLELLKKNLLPIIVGIVGGSFTALTIVILLGNILNVDEEMMYSLMPKSITTPIGVEVSTMIGGIAPLTVVFIVITGIFGAVFAEKILHVLNIKDPVAQGIAIGASSHALGTTKALKMGKVQGAMSGLAIGVTGLVTVILAPLILKVFM